MSAMTEEEARKKWCPFVRIYVTGIKREQDIGTHNRIVLHKENDAIANPADARCIASECMAWRWNQRGMLCNEDGSDKPVEPRQGYCGLAGSP